jgi:hypothetical protein
MRKRIRATETLKWALIGVAVWSMWDMANVLSEFSTDENCFGRSEWALPNTAAFWIPTWVMIGALALSAAFDWLAKHWRKQKQKRHGPWLDCYEATKPR